jgi:hypothetical protein
VLKKSKSINRKVSNLSINQGALMMITSEKGIYSFEVYFPLSVSPKGEMTTPSPLGEGREGGGIE